MERNTEALADFVERLHAWAEAGPRPWETWAQFERRIRLIGDRLTGGIAKRWVDAVIQVPRVRHEAAEHVRFGGDEWSDQEFEA